MAARGLRPVVAVYSTFIQRAVDSVIHDVCFQNLPVVFVLDRAGFVNDDGETHQGMFDISLFRSVPNITILAPAGREELIRMLEWALASEGPSLIRYPKDVCPPWDPAFSLPLEKGRGVWIRRNSGTGGDVCICFTGSLCLQVLDAAERLGAMGIDADLYNLRFIKPVDEDYLFGLMNSYRLVVFAEEGMQAGGFGEYGAALMRNCSCRVLVLAAPEAFEGLGKRHELLRANGLDGEGIAAAVSAALVREEQVLIRSGAERAGQ
jgi:1-deoxy-D-xylulose-5-phosphate synthase